MIIWSSYGVTNLCVFTITCTILLLLLLAVVLMVVGAEHSGTLLNNCTLSTFIRHLYDISRLNADFWLVDGAVRAGPNKKKKKCNDPCFRKRLPLFPRIKNIPSHKQWRWLCKINKYIYNKKKHNRTILFWGTTINIITGMSRWIYVAKYSCGSPFS